MANLSAIVAAHAGASFEWNGRPFVRFAANIERGPDDRREIVAFYRRIEDALRPLGFHRWGAGARCVGGEPEWRASITLVGPGEWADRKFIDDLIARAT